MHNRTNKLKFVSLINETFHSADFLSSNIKPSVKLNNPFLEGQKIWKKKSHLFKHYWVDNKTNRRFFSNFMALIYYHNCTKFYGLLILSQLYHSCVQCCWKSAWAHCSLMLLCNSPPALYSVPVFVVHSLSLCRSLGNLVPSLRGHWPKEVRNTWLSIVVLGLVSTM